jgi:hypothetical protein
MHQHSDRLAVLIDTGELAFRPLRRQRKRPPLRVDIAAIEPVADLERRVTERLRERVAQSAGARLAEIDDEVRNLRPRPRLHDEPNQERDCQRAQCGLVDQQRCVRQLRGGESEAGGRRAHYDGTDERRGGEGGQPSAPLAPERPDVGVASDHDEECAKREGGDVVRPDRRIERGDVGDRNGNAVERPAESPGRVRQGEVYQRPAVQV